MRRFGGFLIIVAVGASLIAWYVLRDHPDADALRDQAKARTRARFVACLIGQPASDRSNQRLRAVMLASHDDPTWPKRCIPYAKAAEKATGEKSSAVPFLDGTKREEVFETQVTSLLYPRSDKVDFAAVTRDVPRPKEPTHATDLGHLHTSFVDDAVGDTDLTAILGREVACRFAPKDGGLEPIARCSFLADGVRVRRPIIVKGSGEVLVHDYKSVFSWRTGARLMERPLAISPARSGDTILGLAEGKRATLLVQEGGKLRELALDRPANPRGELTLASDQLVWLERGHVFARALLPVPGPVTDLGVAPDGIIRRSCAANGTVAVILEVDNTNDWQLALRVGDRWKLVGPIPVTDRSRLECQKDRAVVMTIAQDGATLTITRADCTLEGCKPASVELARQAKVIDVVPDGDEVVLVWAHDAVWMARGRLADLAGAKRIALYDGIGTLDHYIANSKLVQGIRVFVRGASTIVLLQSSGTLAVHARDGRVERVRPIYE
jgi:hypothetical protein